MGRRRPDPGEPMGKYQRQKYQHLHLQKAVAQSIAHRGGDSKPFTYRILRDALQLLTEAQLDQEVQSMPPHSRVGVPALLEPVIGIGTCEEMLHVEGEVITPTRNVKDFEHHPEQLILLRDGPPFDEEGNTMFTMEDGYMVGNKTGKKYPWIDRRKGEPPLDTCRTKAFDSQMTAPTEVLDEKLVELANKMEAGTITNEEAQLLNNIQAELYRRLYWLERKDAPRLNMWLVAETCPKCKANLTEPRSVLFRSTKNEDTIATHADKNGLLADEKQQDGFLKTADRFPDEPKITCAKCETQLDYDEVGYVQGSKPKKE